MADAEDGELLSELVEMLAHELVIAPEGIGSGNSIDEDRGRIRCDQKNIILYWDSNVRDICAQCHSPKALVLFGTISIDDRVINRLHHHAHMCIACALMSANVKPIPTYVEETIVIRLW